MHKSGEEKSPPLFFNAFHHFSSLQAKRLLPPPSSLRGAERQSNPASGKHGIKPSRIVLNFAFFLDCRVAALLAKTMKKGGASCDGNKGDNIV